MQIDLNWWTLFPKFMELTFGSCICKLTNFSSYPQDALRTFLLRKLDNLEKDDKCQITMISTWATELYLDKVLPCAWNFIGKLFTTFIPLSLILWTIAWIMIKYYVLFSKVWCWNRRVLISVPISWNSIYFLGSIFYFQLFLLFWIVAWSARVSVRTILNTSKYNRR
jgi:hypothetical protein